MVLATPDWQLDGTHTDELGPDARGNGGSFSSSGEAQMTVDDKAA
jgi:hypothetical protein